MESECSCGCGADENCMQGDLIDVTKEAKHKLLKKKIMDRLDKTIGKRLDELADLAVEMLTQKIEMKKRKAERRNAMSQKIQGLMEKE